MATDRPPKGILLSFEARECAHTNLFPRTHTQFWMIVLFMVHAEGLATSHSQDRAHEVALDTNGEHAGRHRPS